MFWRSFLIAAVAAMTAVSASAEQVCVEEVAGVCLKYRAVAPKKAAPAQPARPAGPTFANTPEAAEEKALNLNRNEYRLVQSGLRKMGYYTGGIDGVMGGGTREALAAWQAENGVEATGYLTLGQVLALQEGRPLAPPAPIAAAPTDPAPEVASPAADLPPLGKEHVERFANRDPVAGGDVIVTATRVSETSVTLSVRLRNATIASFNFSDTCDTPVSGRFTCQIQTRNSGAWQVVGEYPDVEINGKALTLW